MITNFDMLQIEFAKALAKLLNQIKEAKKSVKTECEIESIDNLEFVVEELSSDTTDIINNS